MDIAGKVVVVTGAGNGIGREVALALLDRRAAGIPDATGELLYLRAPDAIPSAGPKRVSA